MYRKLPKSLSTQNLTKKKKRAGSVPSSLKGTQTNFKFREPFFLHYINYQKKMRKNHKNI